jgi:glycosyltransferase involved in cell wall biosynthesis
MGRVLLISSNSSGRGGGERYLVYLAVGLRLCGHEVAALVSSSRIMDGWAESLAEAGVQVERRPLLALRDRRLRFLQAVLDREQQQRVTDACRSVQPSAIVVNQQYDEDALDYLAGAIHAEVAPVAAMLHLPMTRDKHLRPFGRIRGALLRQWYRHHNYLPIFASRGSQSEFESYYPAPRPTSVVHHGVPYPEPTEAQGKIPAAWMASPRETSSHIPIVGFVGQFVPQKNLELLVGGWSIAHARGVRSRLLLVGDGPSRPMVERQLSGNVPPDLWHITGWTEHPEHYLGRLDLLVMTSRFEGLSFALIEAVGCGIPAVVTDFNGARDVAAHAPWVQVVDDATVNRVGAAIADSVDHLDELRRAAVKGQDAFRAHFSLRRMARDTIATLGLS